MFPKLFSVKPKVQRMQLLLDEKRRFIFERKRILPRTKKFKSSMCYTSVASALTPQTLIFQ